MRAFLLCLLFISGPAFAQGPWQARSLVSVGGAPPAYTGPGDIATYVFWWGLRAYNAAYATGSNNALRIIRASDSTTLNVVIKTDFTIDSSSAATFCASTTCLLDQFYDQTGNGHTGVLNVAGGKAAVQFSGCPGSAPMCISAGPSITTGYSYTGSAINQPYTLVTVAQRTGSDLAEHYIIAGFNGAVGGGILSFNEGGTANNNRLYCGSDLNVTATDGALHSIIGVCNGASSILSIDNITPATGNAGATATSTSLGVIATPGSGVVPIGGFFFEGGITNSALTSGGGGTIAATCNSARIAWGVFSC